MRRTLPGYLAVTGLIAWVVFGKLRVAVLRKAWLNLNLIWAAALLVTSVVTLLSILLNFGGQTSLAPGEYHRYIGAQKADAR